MWWCWTGSTPGPGPSPPGDACDERIARGADADRAKGPDTGAPSRTPSVAADVISSSRSLPAPVRWRVSLRQHCPHRRSHAPSRAPGSGVAHTREPPETDRQTRGSEPAREWRPASTPSRTRPVSPTVADGSTTSRAAPSTGVPSVGRTRCAGGYPHSSSSTAVPWRHRDRRRRKRPRHGGAGRQCALPGRQARLRRRGYNYSVACVVVDADHRAYTFAHTGNIAGTFESGSRDDPWGSPGQNEQIAQNWRSLCAGTQATGTVGSVPTSSAAGQPPDQHGHRSGHDRNHRLTMLFVVARTGGPTRAPADLPHELCWFDWIPQP
jgi:hypothetical protein